MVEFYLLTFPRIPLRKKEHKSYFGKNRTHDFRTSRCAAYLLDHSGDECTMVIRIFIIQAHDPVIHLEVAESSRRSHKKVRGKRKELGSSLHTCQGYDTQMLFMHGLSYGPALTRNTKERASVCQSDQVGLRPSRVTTHPYDPDPNCLQLHVFYSELSCRIHHQFFLQSVHQLLPTNRSSNLLAERDCIIVLWVQ